MSINVFCKGILKELSEEYEVIALSSPGKEMDTIAAREGVRTIAVPMERHISLKKDVVALCRLVKVFRSEKPDMVHSMTPKAGLLCMMAAWLTKVPVRVHTFTGLVFPTSTGLKRFLLKTTDAITCACATHIIPEGEGVKRDLQNYHVTRKPLQVLGFGNVMGVDMQVYSRRPKVMEKAALLRAEGCFTFVYVGRIVGDKGINELCEAFSQLCSFEPKARLFLVGWAEDMLDPISQQSKDTIASNPGIELVGEKHGDELLAYYAVADCFVMPSYREGFPNTVLEAGAMGAPCIVTDINGSREIIVEGENGYIVPPRDAEALREAMLRMMNDDKSRTYMASNARKMIGTRFEQRYVRQCLYDFYHMILPSKS